MVKLPWLNTSDFKKERERDHKLRSHTCTCNNVRYLSGEEKKASVVKIPAWDFFPTLDHFCSQMKHTHSLYFWIALGNTVAGQLSTLHAVRVCFPTDNPELPLTVCYVPSGLLLTQVVIPLGHVLLDVSPLWLSSPLLHFLLSHDGFSLLPPHATSSLLQASEISTLPFSPVLAVGIFIQQSELTWGQGCRLQVVGAST